MKKLLLSLAVAALATPAFAASVNSILGVYDAGYELMYAGSTSEKSEVNVTITQVSGNDVEISPNLFSFLPDLAPIPATYNPDDNTLSIWIADLDANGRLFRFYYWEDEDADGEALQEVILEIDEEGVITTKDDLDSAWYVSDPSVSWWDYIWWGVTLYPVEVGAGGGDEPGEEPGESTSIEIEVTTENTDVLRFDTNELVWGDPQPFPGSSFFAGIWTSSDPLVEIYCLNGNREDEPGINNIGAGEGVWYSLYSANAGNGQLAVYRFIVEEGYVIESISAYLNGEGTVTWTYEDEEFVNNGSELSITPKAQEVELIAEDANGAVKPTVWEDFVIVVAKEGSSAVKGLESVDADAPVVFYDLQGRKIANPSNGIFIRQQGGKTSKVVVR